MAAAAWVEASRSPGAARSALFEPVEFLAGEEPLVLLDSEAGHAPSGIATRGALLRPA